MQYYELETDVNAIFSIKSKDIEVAFLAAQFLFEEFKKAKGKKYPFIFWIHGMNSTQCHLASNDSGFSDSVEKELNASNGYDWEERLSHRRNDVILTLKLNIEACSTQVIFLLDHLNASQSDKLALKNAVIEVATEGAKEVVIFARELAYKLENNI